MVASSQITPGMILSIGGKLYRVESISKVSLLHKGPPFIKLKVRDINTNELVEKNLKPNQNVDEVTLTERRLEFLYPEKNGFLFLDVVELDQIHITSSIVEKKANFLKEGIEVKAFFYGDIVFSIELPQFLELMISKVVEDSAIAVDGTKVAYLETGAKIDVPSYIETGDIIKVDTKTEEFIQRV